ncbi:MAG: hypothetical protein WCC54_17640, partial [Pseudolabrys sp.]
PGNATITIPAVGSAEDRLSLYLASASPGETNITLDRISFDTDSAVLTAESSAQLDNIATILRAYPRAHVAVVGWMVGRTAKVPHWPLPQVPTRSSPDRQYSGPAIMRPPSHEFEIARCKLRLSRNERSWIDRESDFCEC